MDKRHALSLVCTLMMKHGLSHWDFKFDHSVSRFGACWYHKRLITLSAKLVELNDETQVRDTILHEIAHALAGHGAGHGPIWKQVCRTIGAKPQRCYSQSDVVQPKAKLKAICGVCDHVTYRNRRPKRGAVLCCGKCYRTQGHYSPLTYRRNFDYEMPKVQQTA